VQDHRVHQLGEHAERHAGLELARVAGAEHADAPLGQMERLLSVLVVEVD
jgi:hypothetical protein